MKYTLDDAFWNNIQAQYPLPIAFVLKAEVMEAATPREQTYGLIRLFNTALQYAALVAASNYAVAPFKEEQVSYRLERLKRPLVSDFAHFLQSCLPALQKRNALFVPELAIAIQQAQKEQVQALRIGERGFEPRKLPLLEALANLRNALSHEKWKGQWDAFIEHHAPLVMRFLQLMDWCAKYPLLRLVGEGKWIRLMGAEPTFIAEPICDEALSELARAQREGELTGLLLASPDFKRFFSLYPFILWADCPLCQQEPLLGLTEEIFLFNGEEGRRLVAYIGVSHSRLMSEPPKEQLDNIFAKKEFPPEPIEVTQVNYPVLHQRASRQSEIWLQENIRAHRYIPQVYYPRKEMETELERFLKGKKTGFLLLGEAGIGKTNLLCHKVDEWREQGEIVLFYAGHQLSAKASLEERIMSDLHLRGDFQKLLAFLRKEGRRLILIVDGVNEHPEASSLMENLCTFAQRYAGDGTIKVILSFRSAFFEKALQMLAEGKSEEQKRSLEDGLFPTELVFQTHLVEREGRKVETYRFSLERVDEAELESIYEAYRAFEGRVNPVTGEMMRFHPRTPFSSLSKGVRGILTHPWYLRMVMEAYDGGQIPQTLWTGKILQTYCERKIWGKSEGEQERLAGRAELVEELVKLMREHRRDTFYREELHDLSPQWSRILLERELTRSPYLQLVDEGVLIEVPEREVVGWRVRTRYSIRFSFDPLFEYLLSDDILREVDGWGNLTSEHLVSLLVEGILFDHLTGAVEILLTEAAQKRSFALLTDTLNAAGGWLAIPVFVRLLMTLEGMGHENFQPLVEHLAQNAQGDKAIALLLQASYEFGTKQRYRPLLLCSDLACEVAQRAVKEGRFELANDLAMALVNKGLALRSLGRLTEAIACCDEGIEIRRRLIEGEGRFELANDLAKALMNKGLALQSLGRLTEAIACYDEGIEIRRRLIEGEGRFELANDLAMALVYKGNALCGLGRLTEAIACCDEGIEIYRRLIEGEGRFELANNLAKALMNKGVALDNLGRLTEAIACYDEGIEIRRRLIEGEGRFELANDLAMALVYKGNALCGLGRLTEAIACCDEGIEIYRRLIEEEGRFELANNLAKALGNKGNALCGLGRLTEAIACYDEGIEMYRRLIEEEGRFELANDLAKALGNKGVALEQLQKWQEALNCYNESIALRERMVEAGMTHLMPDLIMGLGVRFNLLWKLGHWQQAAADVIKALNYAQPFFQSGSPPEPLVREFESFVQCLRALSRQERAQLYSALGEWADVVRGLVEG